MLTLILTLYLKIALSLLRHPQIRTSTDALVTIIHRDRVWTDGKRLISKKLLTVQAGLTPDFIISPGLW